MCDYISKGCLPVSLCPSIETVGPWDDPKLVRASREKDNILSRIEHNSDSAG